MWRAGATLSSIIRGSKCHLGTRWCVWSESVTKGKATRGVGRWGGTVKQGGGKAKRGEERGRCPASDVHVAHGRSASQ
jgi:hypothetical protein